MTSDSALLQMVGGGSGGKTVKGMHGVFATTPDPDRHTAVGGGGEMGFVLPLANLMTGAQPGFDQSRAGKVIINPNENMEGIAVDLSRVTPEDMSRAMRMSADPSEALEKLAAIRVQPKSAERPMTSLNVPTGVDKTAAAAPIALPASAFHAAPGMPIPQPPINWPGHPSVTASVPYMPTPMAPAPVMAQPDQIGYLLQTLQGMQNQLDQMRSTPQTSHPLQAIPPQTQSYIQPTQPQPATQPAADLSSLDVPWISAEVVPPGIDVMFDLGQGGFTRAKYHHAEITDETVILIFDTRFPYATEYTPPYVREKGQAPIVMQIGKSKTKILAHHFQGMDFALGVFHFTVMMVRHEPAEPEKSPADML